MHNLLMGDCRNALELLIKHKSFGAASKVTDQELAIDQVVSNYLLLCKKPSNGLFERLLPMK